MPKVLFVLTSQDSLGDGGARTGYYVPEAAHPWHELTQAGIQVDLASIQGGTPPNYGDPEDEVQRAFLNDADVQRQLGNTPKVSDIDTRQYDAVLFVGGHGTNWDFPSDDDVQRIIREIYEADGVVAAVCHGPAALVNATLSDGSRLVEGKTVAAFTDDEEVAVGLRDTVPFLLADALERSGAHHTSVANFQPHVEIDGRLITGQNPASAAPLAKELVRTLTAATSA